MKENDKNYNAVDFARYHSGTMLPEEMHALEKAALEDPFLADALEGYAYSKNPGEELDTIKMQLEERRKQKNVFSLSSFSQNTWWKVAAMFIVIAGAGYFFLSINPQKDTSLAVKENQSKKEDTAIISKIKNDTAASEGNVAFEKTSGEKENNTRAKLPASSLKSFPSLVEQAQHVEKKMKEERLADEKEKTMVMSADKMKSKDITLSDSEDKSFLRSSDTSALVAASADVYSMDTNKAVAMNKKNATLNEVVVTGNGAARKKSMPQPIAKELQGKVSGVTINSSTPYLKDGKEKFDQYIKDNAPTVFDSTGERIPVNILLSFILNEKGKPSNIKVLESSCNACEDEAIRLLKDGPDWVGKPGVKGTVRIQF